MSRLIFFCMGCYKIIWGLMFIKFLTFLPEILQNKDFEGSKSMLGLKFIIIVLSFLP